MSEQLKGIWIPKWILDLDIKPVKMMLLAEIENLDQTEKGCTASNNHFAKRLKCTPQYASKLISELESDKLIKSKLIYKPDSKEVKSRHIFVKKKVSTIVDTVSNRVEGVSTIVEGVSTIVLGENKEENKIEIIKKEKKKNPIDEGVEQIAENQKTRYLSRLRDDQKILEEVARRQQATVEDVLTAAENFATDKILTDQWKYPHYKDFRNHFYNWQRYNSLTHENKSKGVQPGANRTAKKQPIDISTAGNWI